MLRERFGGAVVYAEVAGKFCVIPARWSGHTYTAHQKRRTTAASPYLTLFIVSHAGGLSESDV
jgi:hypothetical protein